MKKSHIAFALFCCFGVNAQTMFVRPITGSQSSYPVADIQKLTFENGNMLVTNNTGTNGTFALSGLRYVSFIDFNLATTVPQQESTKYYAYPNPASDVLHISGPNTMQRINNIQIVSVEGRLLLDQKPADEAAPQVDISALPQGMYLCTLTIGNQQQTIKFLKQ